MSTNKVPSLLLFHNLFTDPILEAFAAWLDAPDTPCATTLARLLWHEEVSLEYHLIERVLSDENRFTRAAEAGTVSRQLLAIAVADLTILGELYHAARQNARPLALPAFLPVTTGIRAQLAASRDWADLTEALAAHCRRYGAGPEGRYHAFRWERGELVGVSHPDPIQLEELIGHDDARATVIRNTEQFLQGRPANNLLLYGDRGTGKSSTVKALVHRYGPAGLRLVEVSRSDIGEMGAIMRAVGTKAQRFILYLDDLSFGEGEGDYKRFKATLEGSFEQRPANVLVYVTSNRKHLLHERHADRPAHDEVNLRDTLQETTSLADRFGMTVIFAAPDQAEYLAIVTGMAAARHVDLPPAELRQLALQWALWQNGRSGRTARQFMDDLCGRMGLQ